MAKTVAVRQNQFAIAHCSTCFGSLRMHRSNYKTPPPFLYEEPRRAEVTKRNRKDLPERWLMSDEVDWAARRFRASSERPWSCRTRLAERARWKFGHLETPSVTARSTNTSSTAGFSRQTDLAARRIVLPPAVRSRMRLHQRVTHDVTHYPLSPGERWRSGNVKIARFTPVNTTRRTPPDGPPGSLNLRVEGSIPSPPPRD